MTSIALCANCGKEFEPKNKRHKFCCAECKRKYSIVNAPEVSAICEHCGKEFTYKKYSKKPVRFCSQACGTSHTVPTKICTCVDCGLQFEFIGRTTKKRCEPCRKKHLSKLVMESRVRKNPSVRVGIGSGGGQNIHVYEKGSDREMQRDLRNARRRERYAELKEVKQAEANYRSVVITGNDSCSICGYNKHQEALQVHHIDRDRTNKNPDNLVIICANCHSYIHRKIMTILKEHGTVDPKKVYDDVREAEVKLRNEAGKPTGQPEPKATSNGSQGQSVVAGPTQDISYQEAAARE